MEQIKITDEIHNQLVDTFDARAKNFGFKGKKLIKAQMEFFAGAVRIIDIINESTEASCITPRLYFSLLRGERVTKITNEQMPPITKIIPPVK